MNVPGVFDELTKSLWPVVAVGLPGLLLIVLAMWIFSGYRRERDFNRYYYDTPGEDGLTPYQRERIDRRLKWEAARDRRRAELQKRGEL